MKKNRRLLTFTILMFSSISLFAQNDAIELGIRLGGFGGGGAAVDATMPFAGNRIHADLGFYNQAVGVAAFYDWSFPIADKFSFYPGLGAEIAIGDIFVLAVGGEIGFEYAFDIPLSMGMDWRPTIRLFNSKGFGSDSFGLNIRYRF